VLTGWETVPAAFVTTAWQHRDRWGAALDDVRLLTLGLLASGVRPGQRLRAPEVVTQLAVLAAGAVAVVDGSPADELPDGDLRAGGRRLDAERPDAFEQAWQALAPSDDALVADATFSHANVVAAVRSLAAATGAGPGRHVEVRLAQRVVGAHLLAPLTGAGTGPGDIVLAPARCRTARGFAGVVSLDGEPLPGVTVAGRRIRSDAAAAGCLVDGWLEAA
jgi:hypothetical protein